MTDETPFTLVRAISVRVSCMIHDSQYITGKPTVYVLGHGRTHQETGDARCTACPDDRWLRLEFDAEITEAVPHDEYRAAMLAALAIEFDLSSDEEAHEEADPEATGEAAPPPKAGITFQRRAL